MKIGIYGVRDKVAASFGAPFTAVNDDVAKRQFAFAFNDKNSILATCPGDYELHLLAYMDNETGVIEGCPDVIIDRGSNYAV